MHRNFQESFKKLSPNSVSRTIVITKCGRFGLFISFLGFYWTSSSLFRSFREVGLQLDALHLGYFLQSIYYLWNFLFNLEPFRLSTYRVSSYVHHYMLFYLTPLLNSVIYVQYFSSKPSFGCSLDHSAPVHGRFLVYPVIVWILFVLAYRNTLGVHIYYEFARLGAADELGKARLPYKHTLAAYILLCPILLILFEFLTGPVISRPGYCHTLNGWSSNWPFSGPESWSILRFIFYEFIIQNLYIMAYTFNTFQYQFLYIPTVYLAGLKYHMIRGFIIGGFNRAVYNWKID